MRLVAAAAAVLTVGGIVVAAGTASADNAGKPSKVAERDAVACRVAQTAPLGTMLSRLRDERLQTGRFAAFALGQGGDGNGDGGQGGDGGGQGQSDQDQGDQGDGGGQNCGNDQGGNDQGDNDQGQGDNNENDGNQDDGNQDGQGQGNDAAEEFPGRDQIGGPDEDDFIDIEQVSPNVDEPQADADGSTGSFTSVCGTNEEGHRNSDNFMVAPGKRNGAQHVHDYVGNLSTDAFSDEESLNAADTTCAQDDKSTYFWPVLRDTDGQGDDAEEDGGGLDGNFGEILEPTSVDLEFRGNPKDQVTAMPENLAVITGDAKAGTNGDANARAAWTCTGFEDRTTTKYPLCPQGSQVMRILDFPSCWDGENLDSANHRDHIVFPEEDGSCSGDTVAVPQLRMTLTYQQPDDNSFAMDSFP
ncbi:MAG TPA: DUF1996 domain-containing protein, partial [Pseudonocardiaceae bacterium]|nr:DUF1996 domain-containing protein [Pseudonocardiaceae bacterium]